MATSRESKLERKHFSLNITIKYYQKYLGKPHLYYLICRYNFFVDQNEKNH